MATIQIDIVSAEGEIHKGEAAMVFAPAKMGEVGIALFFAFANPFVGQLQAALGS